MPLERQTQESHVVSNELRHRCLSVRAIVSDVDGILTDGRLWMSETGRELKAFHVRDGMGCYFWKKAGYRLALISKRRSASLKRRAQEMQVDMLIQGVGPKWPAVQSILAQWGLSGDEICYLGDDLPDIAVFENVRLAITVPEAPSEVRMAAHVVTETRGGAGALREVIELILRAQNRWCQILEDYLNEERGTEMHATSPRLLVAVPDTHDP